MAYYNNLVTEKSWGELQKLAQSVKFVLIGDWATYLYTKQLKSKDIDILVDFGQLQKLGKNYEMTKNERLKKYEARREEIQIDIYLPHFSEIGIPVEDLQKNVLSLEGFEVLKKEWLIALKTYVFAQRGGSVKGRKDFLDVVSLFKSGLEDLAELNLIIKKYKLEKVLKRFKEILTKTYEIPELSINRHVMKKLKEEILAKV